MKFLFEGLLVLIVCCFLMIKCDKSAQKECPSGAVECAGYYIGTTYHILENGFVRASSKDAK